MKYQKRILIGLIQDDYQHPYDRKAVEALEKIALLKSVCEYITLNTIEKYNAMRYVGSYIRVTQSNYPDIYEYLRYACQILDIGYMPELYLKRSALIDGLTTGVEQPMMVLSTAIFDCCNEDEILFLVGHECGHIKSGHLLYNMLSQVIEIVLKNLSIPLFSSRSLQCALSYWKLMSEFSADRAGFLCCQNLTAAMSAFIKMAGAPSTLYGSSQPVDFMEQVRNCRDLDISTSNLLQAMIADEKAPWTIVRAAQLLNWTDGVQPRQLIHRYKPIPRIKK